MGKPAVALEHLAQWGLVVGLEFVSNLDRT